MCATCPSPSATSAQHDPVFTAVDGLVREGTLDHAQADRVYLALRSVLPGGGIAGTTEPAPAGQEIARWPLVERLATAAALLGSALALGATLVAAYLSDRFDDGFDGKSFLVALGTTLTLAVVTTAVLVLVTDRGYARWFVAGPVGLGILVLGITVWIAFTDWDEVGYAVAAVLLLGGGGGYVAVRSAAAVAVSVLGGLILFGQVLGDVAPSDTDSLLWISVPAVIYGVVVAVAGWQLPTRHVSAMLGGVVALGGVILLLGVAAFAALIASTVFGDGSGRSGSGSEYSGDAATTMTVGILVCLGLLTLYALSGQVEYAVLGSLGGATVIGIGIFALDVDHALRWAGGVAVIGAAVAAGSALVPLSRYGRPRPQPVTPQQPAAPPGPYPPAGSAVPPQQPDRAARPLPACGRREPARLSRGSADTGERADRRVAQ